MQTLTDSAILELTKKDKYLIPVVEIYPRETEDIVGLSSPANAIGLFSTTCYDWTNSTGTYRYEPKVLEFPEITTYVDDRVNTAEITFSNAKRGDGSMSRFVLNNKIKGCWMVIRLIFPNSPDDSITVFWGKCQKPGEISSEKLTVTATQAIGDFTHEIPFRTYRPNCPLDFARPGGGCLGDQTLEEKSLQYRDAVATYGTAGCNKLATTCSKLGNSPYFQGQRVVAVSGQFSYITIDEVIKRTLFWSKRKKVRVVHTDSWSSVNQSEGDETVPLAFGRSQLQGHPFSWADQGTNVVSLQGFCEGRISAFDFVRSRTQGIDIVQQIEHLGDWGGVGTQVPDVLFNGASGYNSKLAYIEFLTNGSSPTQVDNAPLITAVIRGLEVPLPDANGQYTQVGWTNNPVHYYRFLLNDNRFGKIPAARIDDEFNLTTAAICDSIVEDRTNDEAVVLPSNEVDNYGVGFNRYRSASRWSALKDKLVNSDVDPLSASFLIEAEFEQPEVQWFNPFEPYILPEPQVVLRQKYTFNGALQEKTSLLDFLTKRLNPTFKGYMNYGFNGKIQVKSRQKADNGYLRHDTRYLDTRLPVQNISPWKGEYSGYLLVGVALETAEIREVVGFQYSTACNEIPLTGTNVGGVTVTTSGTMSGGSKATPAMGWIKLDGTVSSGDSVEITIDTGDNQFNISYIADGVEDLAGFTRMLTAFLNAHLQFQGYLTAYILPNDNTKILIRCEVGYLELNRGLEYEHTEAEEILRVQAVFENCGEATANSSAQFDNFVENSFTWNNSVSSSDDEDINAVIATYTSAIDDFHLSKLMPRAAWDTIDLEGELKVKELDLTFVDNYWQAAYLAKSDAIENIDGNLSFEFETDLLALRLELGDVVAVRHDSGDGVLNYIPIWISAVKTDLNGWKVKLNGKLYLSAAYDLHVQPIDVLLTTTLNTNLLPPVPPETTGTNGGISQSSDPKVLRPDHRYYAQFNMSKYSPTGEDVV